MDFLSDFRSPPAACRPHPFWFWNGDIRDEEIRDRIAEMAHQGVGGFYICARQGLQVPYLSAEWFRKVEVACRAAIRYGLDCWLYDEYPYPSGMAGGEVLVRHPEAASRTLRLFERVTEGGAFRMELGQGRILAAQAVPLDEKGKADWSSAMDLCEEIGILQTQQVCQPQQSERTPLRFFSYGPVHVMQTRLPAGRWRVAIVSEEPLTDYKYYGNFFDPCCPEAVRTFLELTHERYAKHLGWAFGTGIKGIFADEVGLLGPVPWSGRLLKEFPKRKGYDLQPLLPALFFPDHPRCHQVRWDCFQVLNELFVNSFHRQVAEWCRKNGLLYAAEVPSLSMGTQRYSSVIGGDSGHEKAGTPLEQVYEAGLCNLRYDPKSAASLGAQLQRPSMIECFHSIGWSMTMQDAKWILDRLAADGIERFTFHAFFYTIEGMTRYDAAPSQFFQNSHWPHARLLHDYAGRLGVFNKYTNPADGIAVIAPIAALWELFADVMHGFRYAGTDEQEKDLLIQRLNAWKNLCKTILTHGMNYQLLGEEMLEQAEVEPGWLCIGRARYHVVVLPPFSHGLSEQSCRKLRRFVRAGGRLITTDPKASLALEGQISLTMDRLPERLIREMEYPAEIRDAREGLPDLIVTRRTAEGKTFLFVANQGGEQLTLDLQVRDMFVCLQRWDMETGEQQYIPLREKHTEIVLPPYGSTALELCLREMRSELRWEPKQRVCLNTAEPLAVSADEPNLLRLWNFEFSIDGRHWKNVDTPTCLEQLAKSGLLDGTSIRWQGKFGTPRRPSVRFPMYLQYRTHFDAMQVEPDTVLAIGTGTLTGTDIKISLNGRPLTDVRHSTRCGCGTSGEVYELGDCIREGDNLLEISCRAENGSQGLCSPIYLQGNFGVVFRQDKAVLQQTPRAAAVTRPYVTGFPYYHGKLVFESRFAVERAEKTQLVCDFGDHCTECVEMVVNGRSIGARAFAPYRWEIPAEYLQPGENCVQLHIYKTLSAAIDGLVWDMETARMIPVEQAQLYTGKKK